MTKPRPGTPSRHLLELATTASNGVIRASSGSAPKALIASISSGRPWAAQTSATACTGLRMPDVVSQWTTATWVISGSRCKVASSAAGSTGTSSSHCMLAAARPSTSAMRSIRLP